MLSHADDLIFTNDSKTNSSAVRPVLIQVSAGQILSLQSTCQNTLFSKEALGQHQQIAANVGAKTRSQPFFYVFLYSVQATSQSTSIVFTTAAGLQRQLVKSINKVKMAY